MFCLSGSLQLAAHYLFVYLQSCSQTVNINCVLAVATSLLWQLQQGGAHQPSATSDTRVTATSSDLPRKSVQEQLPTALPSEKPQAQLADASKQPSRFTSAAQAEQPSRAAPQQQEPPIPPDQETCVAEADSSKGADPSHHTEAVLKPEEDSATQSTVLPSPPHPASSEQRPGQPRARQSSKERVVAEIASCNHKPSEQCTASEARPDQAVQTRHQRTRQGSHQAEAEAQAAANAVVPSVMKLRTGLRSRPDSAAISDKRGLASQVRAEPAHRKQAGVDTARNWPEVTYGSNRGNGRGRAYGRGGRRGRGRSNLFRTSHSEPQPAGTLSKVHCLTCCCQGTTPHLLFLTVVGLLFEVCCCLECIAARLHLSAGAALPPMFSDHS